MKNQKGFAIIEILLVILVVAVLSFAGWNWWKTQNTANKNNQKAQQEQTLVTNIETSGGGTAEQKIIKKQLKDFYSLWTNERNMTGSLALGMINSDVTLNFHKQVQEGWAHDVGSCSQQRFSKIVIMDPTIEGDSANVLIEFKGLDNDSQDDDSEAKLNLIKNDKYRETLSRWQIDSVTCPKL